MVSGRPSRFQPDRKYDYVKVWNFILKNFRNVVLFEVGGGGVIAYHVQLAGIVSHGMDCAKGYLDVYTSVYHHVDWTKKTMKQ